jgi:transposase-like protein
MNCPKCENEETVRNGIVRGKQRYLCHECKYNFTTRETMGKPKEMKRMAIHMYLEGLGFSSIGRILGVSDVAVLKWVKQTGEEVKRLLNKGERKVVECMELDELWHYLGKKKESGGSGWLLIELRGKYLDGQKVVVARQREENYGSKSKT